MNRGSFIKQWIAACVVTLVALFSGVAAHAALQAAGPANAVGFPAYYTDTTGFALAPCLDQNGFCILPPPLDTPAAPITASLPINDTNFPSELFYWFAEATLPAVGPTGADQAILRLVLEGAFAGGPVLNGDQMTFLRINLKAMTDLTPGTYTVTHPFGTFTFTADATGVAKGGVGNQAFRSQDGAVGFTTLLPATTTGIGPFLKCATGPVTAPDGNMYIGNPVVPCVATAGPNGNAFTITGPNIGGQGINTVSTTQFTFAGKMVGMTVAPTAYTFAPTNVAGLLRTSAPFTVTNISTTTALTLGAFTFTGSPEAGQFTIGPTNTCAAPIPASGSCTFDVNFTGLAPSGVKTATVTIPVTAPANTPSGVVTVSGSIDAVPPAVISTNPADGAVVPANTTITEIFSESMLASTFTPTTFTVVANGATVDGTLQYDDANKTLTFTPTVSLAIGATVTATAVGVTGATDLAGNALAASRIISFVTTTPDTTPPTVHSTDPADNAAGVPVNVVITVTFHENMHAASINASTFTLTTLSTGASVSGAITYDATTNTATLTPVVPLEPGTPYTVTIKGGANGVDDLAQNKLAADVVVNFLTNKPPTAPGLVSPANGATGQSTTVALTWTKATDDDGDTLSYKVFVCGNEFFLGCNPNVVTASAPRLNGAYFAGLGGLGMAMIGLVSFGGLKGGRRFIALMFAVLLMSGAVISACSSGGGDDGTTTPVPTNQLSFTPANLNAGALYYWKVEADDGKGVVASELRSFRTQ